MSVELDKAVADALLTPVKTCGQAAQRVRKTHTQRTDPAYMRPQT